MGFISELATATQRVANAYRDAALTRGDREIAVNVVLYPLTRDESDRLFDALVKNERIGTSERQRSDELLKRRLAVFDMTVVGLNSTAAATAQAFEALRMALHDADLAQVVTDLTIQAHERP